MDYDNVEALCTALREKNLDKVIALLDAGADPRTYTDNSGVLACPMLTAVCENFIAGLEVLHQAGGYINGAGEGNFTPLIGAASCGHVEAGRWLLRHGAKHNLKCSPNKDAAVSWALKSGHFDFAEMLLQERPDDKAIYLNEAAQCMMHPIKAEIADWLLMNGVSPNLTNQTGESWLRLAQTKNINYTKSLTTVLLAAGADINFLDDAGSTPLHQALIHGTASGFLDLLHAGADPDVNDKDGHSVRDLIQCLRPGAEVASAFKAWEASQAAHAVMTEPPAEHGARPL